MGTFQRFYIRNTQELLAEGWTKAKIGWAKHKGNLIQIFRGMYTNQEITPELVAQALVKARPDVVFEKQTAMQLYTGEPLTFPLQARVSSTALRLGSSDQIELRRSRIRGGFFHEGLPVVSAVELVNSLLTENPNTANKDLLREFMETYYAGKQGIAQYVKDLKQLGRSSKARIREFTEQQAVVGVDSPPEADLIRALRAAGFKVIPQFRLGKYRWDLGVKGLKVVIDVDSKQYHLNSEKAFVVDRWKANSGIMRGWIALRVTANCIHKHLKQILDLLKEIRRQKKLAPRKFPKIDVPPAWQWHAIYTSEWEEKYNYDNFGYT